MVTCGVLQVHAAIWLVGLSSILAPAGKLPPKGHCLRILVIFEKERSQASLSLLCCSAELDWHPGSEHMQTLTMLLKPKRVARKLFKSPRSPIQQEQDRVHHGKPLATYTQKPWSPIQQEQDRVHHAWPATVTTYSKALESHSATTRWNPTWLATSYLLKSPGVPFCENKTESNKPL